MRSCFRRTLQGACVVLGACLSTTAYSYSDPDTRTERAPVESFAGFGVVSTCHLVRYGTDPACFEEFYMTGTRLGRQGDFAAAVYMFTKALAIDPQSALALNNRGAAYMGLKKPRLALPDFDRALELNSDQLYARYNRAVAHTKLRRFDRAFLDIMHALAIEPDNPLGFQIRGDLYKAMGLHTRAAEDHAKAEWMAHRQSWLGRAMRVIGVSR